MVQALEKYVEQPAVLPDEPHETCIHKFEKLCESCGCNNERKHAAHLAEEGRPRACPLSHLLRACCQCRMEIKLRSLPFLE